MTDHQIRQSRRATRQIRIAAAPEPLSEEFRFKFLGISVLTAIALVARLVLLS